MQKTSKRHKLTSDNNIIQFKKSVHDPFNMIYKPVSSLGPKYTPHKDKVFGFCHICGDILSHEALPGPHTHL